MKDNTKRNASMIGLIWFVALVFVFISPPSLQIGISSSANISTISPFPESSSQLANNQEKVKKVNLPPTVGLGFFTVEPVDLPSFPYDQSKTLISVVRGFLNLF